MDKLYKFVISLIIFILLVPLTVCATSLEDALVGKLREQFDLDSTTYRVEITFSQLAEEDINPDLLTLEPLTPGLPLGSFTVMAHLDQNSQDKQGQVRYQVKKYAEVLVAEARINRHEELTESQLVLKTMDVTSLQEQPVMTWDAIGGMRSKRNISKGRIITTDAIEPVPDIDVGREVTIVYNNGPCEITIPGKALQSGVAGDYIKIRNETSGKIIIARVVNTASVAIDP
jgi:flagella basal body P-ring formation protein FlgA